MPVRYNLNAYLVSEEYRVQREKAEYPTEERSHMKKRQQQRRQEALMRKRQKKRAKEKQPPPMQRSPKQRIRMARVLPIKECLINRGWQKNGMARIFLSRKQPDGNLTFASYLVDVFCLGLKNTMCNVDMPALHLDRELKAGLYADDPAVPCSPHLANQIIYGAIEYAAELGFRPNKDFRDSQHVLEERDPTQEMYDVSFGKDGKPFFIAGPYDDADRITAMLRRKLGPDGFHYLMEISPEDLKETEWQEVEADNEEDVEDAEWEEIEDDEEEDA